MSTKAAYDFDGREKLYKGYALDALLYSARDASEAARAMQGFDPTAEAWYRDDVSTITSEIRRREAGVR